MNIGMAVQARACEKFVLASRSRAPEGMEIGVGPGCMGSFTAVAVLAQERHFLGKELSMIASVGLMADQAVFIHGGMLPHKRSPFFSVTLKAELIDRIRLQHLIRPGSPRVAIAVDRFNPKSAHRIVAAGTLERLSPDKDFIDRMMGLLVCLSPDIPMTAEAEIRFGSHQQVLHAPVDGMAAIARVACKHVPVHVPECQSLRLFVAGQAF